jgi:hypothetical protein
MKHVIRSLLAALALALTAAPASASPAEVARALPGAQSVGQAPYRVLTFHVFDAELWAERAAFSWERPFALSLTYQRSIPARAIVNRTITEMTQRGAGTAQSLEPLRTRLETCFADVRPGDRITGVSTGQNTARFYYNGARRCDVEWTGFRRDFFGIWLDARGSQRALSTQLRGGA